MRNKNGLRSYVGVIIVKRVLIVKVKEHYEIYVNDAFYCSCDDLTEAEKELKELKNQNYFF